MSDIVERLRRWARSIDPAAKPAVMCEEAADEIERLQDTIKMQTRARIIIDEEIEQLRTDLATMTDCYAEISRIVGHQGNEEHSLADDVRRLRAEIERLRADVATLSYTATAKADEIERLQAQLVLYRGAIDTIWLAAKACRDPLA